MPRGRGNKLQNIVDRCCTFWSANLNEGSTDDCNDWTSRYSVRSTFVESHRLKSRQDLIDFV